MVNQTDTFPDYSIGSTEIIATLFSSLCVFFNSFIALLLWKIDIIHLILMELIGLCVGTILGVTTFEFFLEIYSEVSSGTLDFINVTIVLTIGWTLPLVVEKFLKRGKGNKYKRLLQSTGLDGTASGGVPKSLRTHVAEKIAEKEKKAAERKQLIAKKAATTQATAERSVSDPRPDEQKVKADADVEMAEIDTGALNIAIHDDEGNAETVAVEGDNKPKPQVSIQTSSSTSELDSANSSNSPNSSALAKFDVDDANLSPRTKETEKALEGDEDETEELARKVAEGEDVPLVIIMLFGDMVHNFVDGGVMATAYHVNTSVGVATFIGIFLEEIPHLTSTFAVFVQAGAPIWKCMVLNGVGAFPFLIGSSTILGVLSAAGANQNQVNYLIPFAAGSFMYVTFTDLLPIMTMYWHGWVRAWTHLLSIGCGLLIQAGIRVYGNSAGSLD